MLLARFVLHGHGNAEGRIDIADFFGIEGTVAGGLFYVKDLTAERQDGLRTAVAALLGGSACRVTLHQEEFAALGILVGAVGQLAGHAAAAQRALALHHLACLAGGGARRCREHYLVNNGLCELGILFEVHVQSCRGCLGHCRRCLGVAELGLGLALELGFRNLYGNDCGEALAEILGRKVSLELVQELVLLRVLLEGAAETHFEALQVRTALYSVDIVDVGIYLLRIAVVVTEGNVNRYNLV